MRKSNALTAIRGKYKPQYPAKYAGNVNRITYRSMWERRFMLYCDRSHQIKKWSSEELHIPYYFEGDDKWHNYYPDFVVVTEDNRTIVVEIKPHFQKGYKKNKAKWKAARDYCKSFGYEFKVMTEKELF